MKNPWVIGAVQIWSEIVVKLWQFLSSVNIQLVGAYEKKKKLYIHSVQPPPFCKGGGSGSNQIFKKGGELDREKGFKISTFRGDDFFQGGCNFHIKNKVKSEIFNDKKVYKQKYFSLP